MASKFKWIMIVLISVLLFGWLTSFYGKKYILNLDIAWSDAYENGNDLNAKTIADKMGYVDSWAKAFYLGHIAVTDSIRLKGKAKETALSTALDRMEWVKFSFPPGANWRYFIILKASIAALLGDTQKASQYATEGCNTNAKTNIDECLIGQYGMSDPYGSRWKAIMLYEDNILYNAIGTGDKTQSIFNQAVALKYFDIKQAHMILYKLAREGRLTLEMIKIYCNPASPNDATFCKTP